MAESKLNSTQKAVSDKEGCFESVGGQALIEGVMMRGPEKISMSVRKSDGTIVTENRAYKGLSKRYKLLGIPVLRGIVSFFESMIIGTKALMFSAQMFDIDEQDEADSNDEGDKTASDEALKNSVIYFSVVLALGLGIVLFILLPNFIAGLIKIPGGMQANAVLYNLIEGIVRITIFLIYIVCISKMKDIQRVFQYHGAEHKSIHCLEAQEELTVENVKKHSRLHPRCGTGFLLQVMVISVLVFSFLGWPNLLARLLSRLIFIPLVAGISYEIIKLGARSNSRFMRLINRPGLELQRLTTGEPDESQIEVAIEALKNAIDNN